MGTHESAVALERGPHSSQKFAACIHDSTCGMCDPGSACTSAGGLACKTFRIPCREYCQNGAARNGIKVIGIERSIIFIQVSDLLKALSTLILNMLVLPSAMQLSDLSPHVRDLEKDLSPAETPSAGFCP